jgi:mono/diheme cytochrome c family protein/uncharacterized membrane protein
MSRDLIRSVTQLDRHFPSLFVVEIVRCRRSAIRLLRWRLSCDKGGFPMKSWTTVGVLATCISLHSGFAHAESISPVSKTVAETVAEVRGVFAEKCSGCHGPDLVRPKGHFGYVLDLRRIAENPEMVIPSSPDESELWMLVKHGEMPPPGAPHGPLSEAQKNIIRAWIADGAQDFPRQVAVEPLRGAEPKRATEPKPVAAADESLAVAMQETAAEASPVPSSVIPRELLWLGRFHLLAIHFPIALVIAAGIGELWSVWVGSRVHLQSASFCIRLAAIAAMPTVILGWLYAAAGNGAGSLQLLAVHRWLGSAAGACIIASAVCCKLDQRRGERSRLFQVLTIAAIMLTVATAHIGGLLAHGTDFFDW